MATGDAEEFISRQANLFFTKNDEPGAYDRAQTDILRNE
jgi:hypothetical protein